MDVRIMGVRGAELVTFHALMRKAGNQSYGVMRPVYCPNCGRHYTTTKPEEAPWAPTVVHVLCADCGGDGWPLTLAAPR